MTGRELVPVLLAAAVAVLMLLGFLAYLLVGTIGQAVPV